LDNLNLNFIQPTYSFLQIILCHNKRTLFFCIHEALLLKKTSPKKAKWDDVIFKRKMAHAIQLKWMFLALKWAVFCFKNCVQFFQKETPANSKQNLNIIQL